MTVFLVKIYIRKQNSYRNYGFWNKYMSLNTVHIKITYSIYFFIINKIAIFMRTYVVINIIIYD